MHVSKLNLSLPNGLNSYTRGLAGASISAVVLRTALRTLDRLGGQLGK
jgi:hypothetical protein